MQKIAVIVPVHNEELCVLDTINALLRAKVSNEDIYVVDDASKDKTKEIVLTTNVNFLGLTKNGGKANAQRQVISYFDLCNKYDYVVFLDGDTIVHPEFMKAFQNAAEIYRGISLFVGQVKSTRAGYISACRSVEYTVGHDLYKSGQSNFGLIFVAPGCVSMYKTKMLKKLKLEFDTLAEDMDLTMQVHRNGGKVMYVPDAVVYTQDPATIKDYIKQVVRWQRGGWQVFKKHKIGSWCKKQPIDYMVLFLTADAMLFNRILLLGGALIFLPLEYSLMAIALEILVSFGIACYAAMKNSRFDVVYKFPLYFWINYINILTYFKTFYEVVIKKQNVLDWNKVKRFSN